MSVEGQNTQIAQYLKLLSNLGAHVTIAGLIPGIV